MPKNDFKSTHFANFVEVVLNFGRSDDLVKKCLFSIYADLVLMPNLIKTSWTVSIHDLHHYTALLCMAAGQMRV